MYLPWILKSTVKPPLLRAVIEKLTSSSLTYRDNVRKLCSTKNRKSFGNRYLKNPQKVFEQNSWDNVEWSDEFDQEVIQKIETNSQVKLPMEKINDYEENASRYWNDFYIKNNDKFFKDRQWIFTEFPELAPNYEAPERIYSDKPNSNLTISINTPLRIFEIGCGVGNAVFPILKYNNNTQLMIYCSDFSEKAINILKNRPEFDNKRCNAFILDATKETWNVPFEENSLDLIILIFVLNTINPAKIPVVLKNCFKYLKPGGQVVFRDRGRCDLAQVRIKVGRCLTDNFYVNGNGTRAYFFNETEVGELFENAGFTVFRLWTDKRLQINRKLKLKMYRVWILGKFIKISY